ncbi:MAG: MarR family transcriptional regulator [Defluviitaleaceae bacterium]|nr:MarR family transcriptional regulator [Defluviitaleaceae bacterium]MCL2835421.1 MarR family transcriptional regulator [Defluviitaleaceae bacterium]
MKELYENYAKNTITQMQAIFTSIFILQNRFGTAYEKEQDDLTIKQWLLLTMVQICPKPHTLTNVSVYMGCSRQNTKQLAMALSKKGYVRLILGEGNSVNIELTEKLGEYEKRMGGKHEEILRLLFSDFTEKEISLFYQLYKKLYTGVERIEKGQK